MVQGLRECLHLYNYSCFCGGGDGGGSFKSKSDLLDSHLHENKMLSNTEIILEMTYN